MSDDYEAELHGPHDHPVIATLAGCAVLIAAAVLVPIGLPAQPQNVLVGGFAAAGFLLWLIGFLVTTRLSSLGWKAGSLAILLAAGALAGYLTHRQYQAGGRQDPSSFAEIEFGPQGAPVLGKTAAARGPVSKLFAESVQADTAERRAFGDALGKIGVGSLNSPYLVTQNPQAISRCSELETIRTLARDHSAKRTERAGTIGRAIDDAAFDAPLKDAIRTIATPAATSPDAVLANQLAGLDATAQLCALLAKRSWYNANGYFGFNNGSDMQAYKRLQALRADIASEAERIDKAAAERMKQGQEKLRALLS